jgi:hypothetical protein
MKKLIHNVAAAADELGILDKIAYRNLCWKIEFEEKLNTGSNAEQLIIEMSERLNMSIAQIDKIVYPRGEKKDASEKVVTDLLKIKKPQRRVHYNRKRK